jgi:hypothetical protein
MQQVFILGFNSLTVKILYLLFRFQQMRFLLLLCLPFMASSQESLENILFEKIKAGGEIKEELLSRRSAVLYAHTLTAKEIQTIHDNFINTGIDAVAYFETDVVLAGKDIAKAYATYFVKREIAHLIIIKKTTTAYSISVVPFNGTETLVDANSATWTTESPSLNEALTQLYRTALAGNKRKNFLINDFPETGLPVTVFTGRRSELFAYDLKVDKLAVVKFGHDAADNEVEEIFKEYPLKYKLVDNTLPESELRKQGFYYVLCFVNTRNTAARKALDYSVTKTESAFVSVTYPHSEVQLKNIPAHERIVKFYVRHIDSGNVFLTNKWDADITWQQALKNFIKSYKAEFKLN